MVLLVIKVMFLRGSWGHMGTQLLSILLQVNAHLKLPVMVFLVLLSESVLL